MNSLIIEDGSGKEDANSYASVLDLDNFLSLNYPNSPVDEAVKETCLLQATIYLDGNYTFVGEIKTKQQSLLFPRIGQDARGREIAGVPIAVVKACCELAFEHSISSLSRRLVREDFAITDTVDIGSIRKQMTYSEKAPPNELFPKVEALLKPFLTKKPTLNILEAKRGMF